MGQYIYLPQDPKHPREWIVCKRDDCPRNGEPALVKAHGKGFCSKSCAQRGPENSMAKRTPDNYNGIHNIVHKVLGKASSCVWGCESSRYEWAHMLGEIGSPDEYVEMCKRCHHRFDFAIKTMEPGYRAPHAKLSESIVRECRKLHAHDVSIVALAERYGVSQTVMRRAISGQQWKFV